MLTGVAVDTGKIQNNILQTYFQEFMGIWDITLPSTSLTR